MRYIRRSLVICAALVTTGIVVIALGSAAGRWRPVPVSAPGRGVHASSSDVAVVVPVPVERLHEGDVVLAQPEQGTRAALLRVAAIDSWTKQPIVIDATGRGAPISVGKTAWRLSYTVPLAGAVYSWLVGTLQAVLLLLVSMLLVARAGLQRRRARASRLRNPWWWSRLVAAVVWALGVLSFTASATFQGSASVTQSTNDTAAHLSLTLAGNAGWSGALTTAATNIAPGDMIQRPLDLQVDSSNTNPSGVNILSKIQLTVTATTNTAGAGGSSYKLDDNTTKSLRFWIQKCSTAWTESGSSPGYTYACTGGAGNTSDIIGSTLPYQPAAGTCAPSSGTVSSVNAVESATDLNTSNTAITPGSHNYLVLFMCAPTAMDDNYQDAQITLKFTFSGVQRSGRAQ